jgi:hypothetical protein
VNNCLLNFVEYDDECVTASEMYSCGREKEPTIVNAIFNTEKGNATVVCAIIVKRHPKLTKISKTSSFFAQYDPPVPCLPFPRIPCQFTKSAPACVLSVKI